MARHVIQIETQYQVPGSKTEATWGIVRFLDDRLEIYEDQERLLSQNPDSGYSGIFENDAPEINPDTEADRVIMYEDIQHIRKKKMVTLPVIELELFDGTKYSFLKFPESLVPSINDRIAAHSEHIIFEF